MSYRQKYEFQKKARYKCDKITNKNEAKVIVKHISLDCKCKLNRTTFNSYEKLNIETCQCECKNCCTCKKDYSWVPSTCIWENDKYSKSILDTSVITCDEIISVVIVNKNGKY